MGMQRGVGATIALVAVFAFQAEAQAQATLVSSWDDHAPPTYASHVASIINENCVVCHLEDGIAPMSLTTYEEVKPWVRRISQRVANQEMPPYAYDTDMGVQDLKSDWRLSEDAINTIVSWVDEGARMGDPADMPPPPGLLDVDDWTFAELFGPPDLIIPSVPIDVPADGNDLWHRPYVPTGLTQDRCIRAVQVKPAGKAKTVVHHANSTFEMPQEDGSFERMERVTEYAMGKIGEIVPEGVCRIALADSYIRWDIHMYPGGLGVTAPNAVVEDNIVELGFWFHPEGYEGGYKQDLDSYGLQEQPLDIPPHGRQVVQGHHTFDHPVRIDSWQPHGHLRMRASSLEIFYPEPRGFTLPGRATPRLTLGGTPLGGIGRTEVVSMVSNWSAVWHQSHIYGDDVAPLVPAGAILILKQWYDNTANSPNNPDPDQWVGGGSRTADEMAHAWIAVTHLDEEGYQKLLEEREKKKKKMTEEKEQTITQARN